MDFHIGILAGGESRRFGSYKAIYKYNGLSLISHIIKQIPKLTLQPRSVLISIHDLQQLVPLLNSLKTDFEIKKTSETSFQIFFVKDSCKKVIHCEIVLDIVYEKIKDVRVPIIGLNSLFKRIPQSYIQIIPCDTPFMNYQVLNMIQSKLIDKNGMIDEDLDLIMPRWNSGYMDILTGVYKTSTFLHKMESNILSGNFRIFDLFTKDLNIYYFQIEEQLKDIDPTIRSFKNINNLADLKD